MTLSPNANGRPPRGITLASGLWVGAAAIVIAGFVLRMFAGLLGLPQLRFTGIAAIAIGLALAVLGWISERFSARGAS
jgi:hypothetical protein